MVFKKVAKNIYEYFSGRPAELQSLYINYRDEDSKPVKEKVPTMDIEETKLILSERQLDVKKVKVKEKAEGIKRNKALASGKLTLDEVANLFFDNRDAINNGKVTKIHRLFR